MDEATGGCLCGQVRFTAKGKPNRVGLCHCLDCRKHSGALFAALAIFPEEAVTVRGETTGFGERHPWLLRRDRPLHADLRALDDPSRKLAAALSPEAWLCSQPGILCPNGGLRPGGSTPRFAGR